MAGRLSVLTPKEAADEFHVPEEVILAELESGRLKGFRFGGAWRTTEDAALALIAALMEEQRAGAPAAGSSLQNTPAPSAGHGFRAEPRNFTTDETPVNAPRRRGRPAKTAPRLDLENPPPREARSLPPTTPLPSLEELRQLTWEPEPPFSHQWPNSKEKEVQDTAFSQIVEIGGKHISLAIGFATRDTAGMAGRRGATVFLGDIGRTLYPLVQFAGANDFETTGLMASIIRDGGRSTVPPDAPLPDGYEELPVGLYNDLITGPYTRKSRCVVAHKDDFAVMAAHALLRGRRNGRI